MHNLMLRPGWPRGFRRTVKSGKKSKVVAFQPGQTVEVTEEEFKQLAPDIGLAVFEVELDEKGRPRFVETELTATAPTAQPAEPASV